MNILNVLPELQGEEMYYVQNILKDMNDKEIELFANIYRSRRKSYDVVLISTIIGFFGVAGIQRFITNNIGLGLLYFFTCGLCFIGTIVDLINYKQIAFAYNQTVAYEVANMIRQNPAY